MNIIPVTDCNDYLSKMRLSFIDKSDFMQRLSPQITTIVDFGCADTSFLHFLKDSFPSYTYYGIENNDEFMAKAHEVYGDDIKIYKTVKDLYEQEELDCNKTHLNMSSVMHELFAYDERPKNTVSEMFGIYEFFSVSIRDMYLYRKPFVIGIDSNSSSRYHSDNVMDMPKVSNIYRLNWLNGLKNVGIKILEQCIGDDDLRDKITDFMVCNRKEFKSSEMIMEFLLKYFYTTNWDRECRENYFIDPDTIYSLHDTTKSFDYKLVYKERYILPYLINKWVVDFALTPKDVDVLNMLTTHIKLFYQKLSAEELKMRNEQDSQQRIGGYSAFERLTKTTEIVTVAPICKIDMEEVDDCAPCQEAPSDTISLSEDNSEAYRVRQPDRWLVRDSYQQTRRRDREQAMTQRIRDLDNEINSMLTRISSPMITEENLTTALMRRRDRIEREQQGLVANGTSNRSIIRGLMDEPADDPVDAIVTRRSF